MSVLISDVITNLDTYIGDSSTDRISEAERFQFITEATSWLKEELENDHSVSTYELDFYDSVSYYKITSAIADMFDSNDLRRKVGENYVSFSNKSSREIAEDISNYPYPDHSSFGIERRDGDTHLAINHSSKYRLFQVSSMDSLTVDGGTWAVDATNSDATNLSINTVDFTQGSGSFNFDVDVSQSGNNKAEIFNAELTSRDLSTYKDLASYLLDVKFPEVDNITSVTLYWGSDISNYYSVTSTTDMNGNAFVADDFKTLEFIWLGASTTGTPDDSAITYVQIDINYGAGQVDATSIKLDNLRLVRPEKLTFHYTDWKVGTDTGGTDIFVFGATTDIPYFSGQYDQYKYPLAHRAAAICFDSLRLYNESSREEQKATEAINRLKNIIPSSVVRESKSYKPAGVNFNRRGRRLR